MALNRNLAFRSPLKTGSGSVMLLHEAVSTQQSTRVPASWGKVVATTHGAAISSSRRRRPRLGFGQRVEAMDSASRFPGGDGVAAGAEVGIVRLKE